MPAGIDRLLAFRQLAKISPTVVADRLLAFLLLEKFSTPVGIDRSRMLIHALWLFVKSDILYFVFAELRLARLWRNVRFFLSVIDHKPFPPHLLNQQMEEQQELVYVNLILD